MRTWGMQDPILTTRLLSLNPQVCLTKHFPLGPDGSPHYSSSTPTHVIRAPPTLGTQLMLGHCHHSLYPHAQKTHAPGPVLSCQCPKRPPGCSPLRTKGCAQAEPSARCVLLCPPAASTQVKTGSQQRSLPELAGVSPPQGSQGANAAATGGATPPPALTASCV